jgi:hypothetical protein
MWARTKGIGTILTNARNVLGGWDSDVYVGNSSIDMYGIQVTWCFDVVLGRMAFGTMVTLTTRILE